MTRRGAVNLHLVLIVALVVALTLFVQQRQVVSGAKREAVAWQVRADSLHRHGDSLGAAYRADTANLGTLLRRWQVIAARARGQRDTTFLPGGVDTISVPVEVLVAVADSTINACTRALHDCEARVATAQAEAAAEKQAANRWKRVAAGPWLQPRLELTLTPQFEPEVAAELTLGRGRIKILGRAEVGQDATVRLGLSWSP